MDRGISKKANAALSAPAKATAKHGETLLSAEVQERHQEANLPVPSPDMTTHTPGPWVVEHPFKEDGVYITEPHSTALICKLYPTERNYQMDKMASIEKNAMLIASSPELLRTMQNVVPFLDIFAETLQRKGGKDDEIAHAIVGGWAEAAREVIGKAGGEVPAVVAPLAAVVAPQTPAAEPIAAAEMDGRVDYTNLPGCGGFALDRPQGLDELRVATHARFLVAEGKHPDAGIEDFTYYHMWEKDPRKNELAAQYVQEGRLVTYARPGDNEGYIVQILAGPTYFDNGSPIPIAHSKCWTREGALALLQEVSELMVRW